MGAQCVMILPWQGGLTARALRFIPGGTHLGDYAGQMTIPGASHCDTSDWSFEAEFMEQETTTTRVFEPVEQVFFLKLYYLTESVLQIKLI